MAYLKDIQSPTLLLDEKIVRSNLSRMALKAQKHQIRLIPHFKTHQSYTVGDWCKDYGVREITVSSIQMATYFAPQNWENIHIAFPFNPREIQQLNKLAEDISISVQLVNEEVTQYLKEQLEHPVGFFIEIDAGYGRTGVHVTDFEKIENILRMAQRSDKLQFRGFYIHAGHTYHADMEGIKKIHGQTQAALHMLKDKYITEFPGLVTRSGDTPSCSIMDNFEGIDEIGPGNFIFYDLTQAAIGSCQKEDIAVALAVPVVDIQKSKNEILVHGGGIHLSKDILIQQGGTKSYGEVVLLEDLSWKFPSSISFVKGISQEHGIIQADASLISQVKPGDLLGILPVHSCMTADCMGGYLSLSGMRMDHLAAKPK